MGPGTWFIRAKSLLWRFQSNVGDTWVFVKIMVPFWGGTSNIRCRIIIGT